MCHCQEEKGSNCPFSRGREELFLGTCPRNSFIQPPSQERTSCSQPLLGFTRGRSLALKPWLFLVPGFFPVSCSILTSGSSFFPLSSWEGGSVFFFNKEGSECSCPKQHSRLCFKPASLYCTISVPPVFPGTISSLLGCFRTFSSTSSPRSSLFLLRLSHTYNKTIVLTRGQHSGNTVKH